MSIDQITFGEKGAGLRDAIQQHGLDGIFKHRSDYDDWLDGLATAVKTIQNQLDLENPNLDLLFRGNTIPFSLADFGIGKGRAADEILKDYPHVSITGVDIACHPRTKTRLEQYPERFRFIQGNIEEVLTFIPPHQDFDVTTASNTAMWLYDPVRFLNGMYALTKPGGFGFLNGFPMEHCIENYSEFMAYAQQELCMGFSSRSHASIGFIRKQLPNSFALPLVPTGRENTALLSTAGIGEYHHQYAVYRYELDHLSN